MRWIILLIAVILAFFLLRGKAQAKVKGPGSLVQDTKTPMPVFGSRPSFGGGGGAGRNAIPASPANVAPTFVNPVSVSPATSGQPHIITGVSTLPEWTTASVSATSSPIHMLSETREAFLISKGKLGLQV